MIALLKVLLAAAPTSRARNTDSLNILVDVFPPENPASMAESNQVTLDINRHKEIIVKAVSATLLLLLKHFKVNHIYQFEYVCQHLVFANCIPLVLKFFNQNVGQYVAARNNFTTLNFPNCVFSPQDAELTNDIGKVFTICLGIYGCDDHYLSPKSTLKTGSSLPLKLNDAQEVTMHMYMCGAI